MFSALVTAVAPVMLAIAAGFFWVRSGRQLDTGSVGPIASDLGMPCLIFVSLARADISAAEFMRTALASLTSLLAFAVLGSVSLRIAGLRLRTYLPSVTWGNAGFLGIPLALYCFGNAGMVYAVVFSSVSLLFNSVFSQCVALGRADAMALVRTPLIYSIAAGIAVAVFRPSLPTCALQSLSLLGGMAIPLALMMVGASLARIKSVAIKRAFLFSAARMAGGALIATSVAYVLGITGIARNVLILQCAMPVAALSYIFAQKWNNDPDEVAGLVAVSTWSSAVSVPALLSLMVGHIRF